MNEYACKPRVRQHRFFRRKRRSAAIERECRWPFSWHVRDKRAHKHKELPLCLLSPSFTRRPLQKLHRKFVQILPTGRPSSYAAHRFPRATRAFFLADAFRRPDVCRACLHFRRIVFRERNAKRYLFWLSSLLDCR